MGLAVAYRVWRLSPKGTVPRSPNLASVAVSALTERNFLSTGVFFVAAFVSPWLATLSSI